MLLTLLYFVGAIAIAGISRRTFGDVWSHGIMRFLAFGAIWAVLLMNLTAWFRTLFSWHRVTSRIILPASAVLWAKRGVSSTSGGRSEALGDWCYAFRKTWSMSCLRFCPS